MCTWDLVDGHCIESVKLYQVHSYIQVQRLYNIYNNNKYLYINFSLVYLYSFSHTPWLVTRMLRYSVSEIIPKSF